MADGVVGSAETVLLAFLEQPPLPQFHRPRMGSNRLLLGGGCGPIPPKGVCVLCGSEGGQVALSNFPLDSPAPPANPISAMNSQPDKMDKALHLKLVAAWWDGELEASWSSGWGPARNIPGAYSDPDAYRIRPKPTLRPWKPEEVPVGAVIRLRNRETVHSWMIVGFSSETNCIAIGQAGERDIRDLAQYEHSLDGGKTWSACGVEESQ